MGGLPSLSQKGDTEGFFRDFKFGVMERESKKPGLEYSLYPGYIIKRVVF
jgi:hypothetical protein